MFYTRVPIAVQRKPTPNTKLLLLLFSMAAVTRDVSERRKSDSEMTDYCIDMWKWKKSISRRAPLWHRTISSTVVSRSELLENQQVNAKRFLSVFVCACGIDHRQQRRSVCVFKCELFYSIDGKRNVKSFVSIGNMSSSFYREEGGSRTEVGIEVCTEVFQQIFWSVCFVLVSECVNQQDLICCIGAGIRKKQRIGFA